MKLNRRNLFLASTAAITLTLSAHQATAQSTWVGGTSDWGTVGNWNPANLPAISDNVIFTSAGNSSVYLGDAARTVSTITFDNTTTATPYTIFLRESSAVATSRRLTVGAGGITVAAGSHTITGNGTAGELTLTTLSAFNVAASSTVTLNARLGGTGAVLTKTGVGTLVLGIDNGGSGSWLTGGFTVSAGTLDLAGNRSSGNTGNDFVVSDGATIKLSFLTAWAGVATGTLTLNGTGFNGVGALYASTSSLMTGATPSPVLLATTSRIGVDPGQTLTIGGNITGTGAAGLEKTGNGILAIGGTNSYTGGTTITTGTLVFLNTNAKSATGTHAFAAGTTLGLGVATAGSFFTSTDVDNAFASNMVGNLSNVTDGGITNVGIDTTAGNFTYGTSVPGSPARGLTKTGINTLTLSGTSTYTGGTNIVAGTLELTGSLTGNSAVSTSGTGIFTQSGTGVLSGSTSFTQGSSGTSVLSLVNNHTGGTNISAGTLSFANGALGTTGNITFTGSGTLQWNGANTQDISARLVMTNGVTSTIDTVANNVTLATGFGSSSTGALTKAGAGILTLGIANTYTGNTTITAGTLSVGVANNLSVAASNLVFDGGTLQVTGTALTSLTSLGRTNPVVFTATKAVGFDIAAANNTFTVGQVLDQTSGGLTKLGAGTLILDQANTYTGATTVSAGVLNLTGNRTASAGQITVGSEGTAAELNISNGNFSIATRMFVGVGASLAGNGTVNQTAGAVTFGSSNDQLLVGTGIGSGTYNLSGGSLTTVARTNRGVMLGVNVGSSGTFILSGTGSLSVASRLQIGRSDAAANNTTNLFSQTGGTASVGTLSIGGGSAPVGTNINGTMTLTGGTLVATNFDRLAKGDTNTVIINIGGTADVTLPGFGDGTALGSGSTATVNFNGGTLKNSAVNTNYLGAISSAFIQVGGAKFDTTGGDSTITQNLLEDGGSTGGGLTKAGSNTLTLAGINTYSGNTTVSNGTLTLSNAANATNANLANDASTVTISDNGTSFLNLTYTGTDKVDKLFFGAAQQPAGVYSAASVPGGATITTASFSGAGTLTVASSPVAGTPYATWAAGFLGFTPTTTTLDFEFDGIQNLLEFVLGGNPTINDSPSIRPTVNASGTDLVVTFNRTDLSETQPVTVKVQSSPDLVTWTNFATIGAGSGSGYTVTENGAAADTIVVTIPKAAATKKFARVTAE